MSLPLDDHPDHSTSPIHTTNNLLIALSSYPHISNRIYQLYLSEPYYHHRIDRIQARLTSAVLTSPPDVDARRSPVVSMLGDAASDICGMNPVSVEGWKRARVIELIAYSLKKYVEIPVLHKNDGRHWSLISLVIHLAIYLTLDLSDAEFSNGEFAPPRLIPLKDLWPLESLISPLVTTPRVPRSPRSSYSTFDKRILHYGNLCHTLGYTEFRYHTFDSVNGTVRGSCFLAVGWNEIGRDFEEELNVEIGRYGEKLVTEEEWEEGFDWDRGEGHGLEWFT